MRLRDHVVCRHTPATQGGGPPKQRKQFWAARSGSDKDALNAHFTFTADSEDRMSVLAVADVLSLPAAVGARYLTNLVRELGGAYNTKKKMYEQMKCKETEGKGA